MKHKPIRSEGSNLQPEVVDNFITMRFQPNIANKCPQRSTQHSDKITCHRYDKDSMHVVDSMKLAPDITRGA